MTDDAPRAVEVESLKPDALAERMKQENPDLAAALTDRQLVALVRQVMQAVAAELNERDEGRLRIPGLGRVQIRQVEREKQGETVQAKRIILQLSDAKE